MLYGWNDTSAIHCVTRPYLFIYLLNYSWELCARTVFPFLDPLWVQLGAVSRNGHINRWQLLRFLIFFIKMGLNLLNIRSRFNKTPDSGVALKTASKSTKFTEQYKVISKNYYVLYLTSLLRCERFFSGKFANILLQNFRRNDICENVDHIIHRKKDEKRLNYGSSCKRTQIC